MEAELQAFLWRSLLKGDVGSRELFEMATEIKVYFMLREINDAAQREK